MIYISGAISKCLHKADARFEKAEQMLNKAFFGEPVFNPCEAFKKHRGEWDSEAFINASLDVLKKATAMAVIQDDCLDYCRSEGVAAELELAERLDIFVFYIQIKE